MKAKASSVSPPQSGWRVADLDEETQEEIRAGLAEADRGEEGASAEEVLAQVRRKIDLARQR